jgi:hypothetical protein
VGGPAPFRDLGIGEALSVAVSWFSAWTKRMDEAHLSVRLCGHQNQLFVRAALSPEQRLVDLHERCYGGRREVIALIG